MPSLSSTLLTCVFTVSRPRYSESAISAFDSPPATSRRTLVELRHTLRQIVNVKGN